MEKESTDSLKLDEFILAEDIVDYIDENEAGVPGTMGEIGININSAEQLWTSSYRRLNSDLKITLHIWNLRTKQWANEIRTVTRQSICEKF